MSRRLIVLCDGTFNDAIDQTNVIQLKNALARSPDQVVFYDEGVGVTEHGTPKGRFGRLFESLAGGAFGYGMSMNVMQSYRWVCENYLPGDHLYFFGFSRGAYTARSIVGMIRKLGLIRPPVDWRTLEAAFGQYRDEHHPNCPRTARCRTELNVIPVEQICLHFLGVWDTVGALGVPVVGPRSLVARRRWGFHDVRLSSHVQVARQALAIDERRAAFLPTPWCAEPERSQRDTTGPSSGGANDVQQLWFSGCHSDIGGSHGEITRRWMFEQASLAGLQFDPLVEDREPPEAIQTWHDSMNFGYQLGTGSVDRPIMETLDDGAPRFRNEDLAPTADKMRKPDGTAIEKSDRASLRLAGTMKGPRPGWGLTLFYYLAQYDQLCPLKPPKPCCDEYHDWLVGDPTRPDVYQCPVLTEQAASISGEDG